MLLGRDVNLDESDDHGRTPLYFAARYGHEGVVAMLVELDEIDPNAPDDNGRRFGTASLM